MTLKVETSSKGIAIPVEELGLLQMPVFLKKDLKEFPVFNSGESPIKVKRNQMVGSLAPGKVVVKTTVGEEVNKEPKWDEEYESVMAEIIGNYTPKVHAIKLTNLPIK